jgi:hypothetical protein
MKKVITYIPNKHHKHDYALLHIENYSNIQAFLDELSSICNLKSLEFIEYIRNELYNIRKL